MGGVDRVIEFGPDDIDSTFREKNKNILDAAKGNGYWLWKPYFIDKVFSEIKEGDWLIYSDSGGLYYQNKVVNFIKKWEEKEIYVVCQKTSYQESHYTKRDAFILMDLDVEEYANSPQRAGGVVCLKKNERNIQIVKEWLNYAQDERVITDMPNTCGIDNYPGFIAHRHDQSIFSLLSKKYGIYTDDCLWVKFSEVNFFKTILFSHKKQRIQPVFCYHHTRYGSLPAIFFHRGIDPVYGKLKRKIIDFGKLVIGKI